MEENEYKSTYNALASVRCMFEKALTNNQARCTLAKHFCLADREGYSCADASSSARCGEILKKLREKSVFVLKLQSISGPLPHNMELRVQVGGMAGMARLLDRNVEPQASIVVDDIHSVIDGVVGKFTSLDALPYSEVVQSVVQFQGRKRRKR